MRLIDADVFHDFVHKHCDSSIEELWHELVRRQPTAYDVDKVVERLEADKKELQEIIKSGARDIRKNTNYGYFIATSRAISIVKSGGIE